MRSKLDSALVRRRAGLGGPKRPQRPLLVLARRVFGRVRLCKDT